MEKRLLLFLVLSLGILVGHSTLMRIISPPRPPVAENKKVDQEPDNKQDEADPTREDAESAPKKIVLDEPEADDPEKPEETEAPPPTQAWTSVGSYDPVDSQSLLVYFNSRGATIERVEITARDKKGKLRYDQLGKQLGYLGYLALTPREGGGCVVNVVGDRTPAALAGIKVGDVLIEAGGAVLNQPAALNDMLDASKPGDPLPLLVERSGPAAATILTLNATLDVRPLELIRPEPLQGDEVKPHPAPYLLSIGEQTGQNMVSIDSPKTVDWEVTQSSDTKVEFKLGLGDSKLELIRRFRLGQVADLDNSQPTALPYHLSMEFELRNKSDTARDLSYTLSGPNGLPTEGWWYSAKIHKRMFYGAGARDVQCKTKGAGWWIVGCPELYKAAKKEESKKRVTLFAEHPNVKRQCGPRARLPGCRLPVLRRRAVATSARR